jgi:predicted transcriptional regulator
MQISRAEHDVLDVLWGDSPLTVGQIVERCRSKRDWHENTIKTLLTRLLKKSAVSRRKDGGRFFYSAAVARDDVLTSAGERLLQRFFDGRMQQFVAHFAAQKKLSRQDIRDMEAILERIKKDVP